MSDDGWKDVPSAPSDDDGWKDVPGGEQKGALTSLAYGAQGFAHGLTSAVDNPIVRAANPLTHINRIQKHFTGVDIQPTAADVLNAYKRFVGENLGAGDPNFPMVQDDINKVPPQYRPAYRAGEVGGSTVPLLAGPVAATRGLSASAIAALQKPGASAIGNIVRGIAADVATKPAAFVASQTIPTIGQGAGAYLAETAFPGSPTAQVAGQLAGGGIGGLLQAGISAGTGSVTRALETFRTPLDPAAAAARRATPEMVKANEDPRTLIANIQKNQAVPGLTAGDAAQSPYLTGLTEYLGKENTDLANAAAAGRQTHATNVRQGLEAGFEPGSQGALTAAAENQQRSIAQTVESIIAPAETAAANAARAVQPLEPAQRELLNVRARDILEGAVRRARTTERDLWSRADRAEVLPVDGTRAGALAARDGLLEGERLPAPIEAELGALFRGQNAKPPTLGNLNTLRSRALDIARDLRSGATPNRDMARRVGLLADGILTDLAASAQPAAQTAREFTRALHNRITRSYAGDILGLKPTGAGRVRPELTLETATTGTAPRVAQQLGELQVAAVPVGTTTGGSAAALAPAVEMQQVQQQFLRTMSQNVVGPDGRVIPGKIDAFLKAQAPMLDRFPQYRTMLENARDTQVAFESTARSIGEYATLTAKEGAFAKVLAAGENPSAAVTKVLNGPNPVVDMERLVQLARMGGADAQAGLRAAVLQHVMEKSAAGNAFSYGKTRSLLDAPLSPGGPSLMETLERTGVVNATQKAAIQKHVDAGMLNEAAKVAGVQVKSFGTDPGMWWRALSRIIGAKAASRVVPGGGAGEGLQIAQIGANIGEKMFAGMPADRAKQFMAQALAAENPAQLIDILERVGLYNEIRRAGPSGATAAIVLTRAEEARRRQQAEPPPPVDPSQYMRQPGGLLSPTTRGGLLQ